MCFINRSETRGSRWKADGCERGDAGERGHLSQERGNQGAPPWNPCWVSPSRATVLAWSEATKSLFLYGGEWNEETKWKSHRIIGLLRLEKASKIIQVQLSTSQYFPSKPHPLVSHLKVSWTKHLVHLSTNNNYSSKYVTENFAMILISFRDEDAEHFNRNHWFQLVNTRTFFIRSSKCFTKLLTKFPQFQRPNLDIGVKFSWE